MRFRRQRHCAITLADAGANLAPIGDTVHFPEFSGELIDQAPLQHVMAGIRESADIDPAGTAAVSSLTRLREECRLAGTAVLGDGDRGAGRLTGVQLGIRVTRAELEQLMAEPFAGFLDALGDALEHNRIPAVNLAAVATVGGGAAIPLVTQTTFRGTSGPGDHHATPDSTRRSAPR